MNVFDAIKIMHFQSNFYLTEFIMLMSFSNMEWLAEIFLGFKVPMLLLFLCINKERDIYLHSNCSAVVKSSLALKYIVKEISNTTNI